MTYDHTLLWIIGSLVVMVLAIGLSEYLWDISQGYKHAPNWTFLLAFGVIAFVAYSLLSSSA
jgi:hypothetical protein